MNANFTALHSDEERRAILSSESAQIFHDYLALQEDSETPRDYLKWSLIAFAAGLLGRNASLRFGPNLTVTPNLYIILLGPSRMRKSSAISMTASLMNGLTLNMAPTDTGAQRHGIMRALTGLSRITERRLHYAERGPLTHAMLNPRRPDDMMIVAQELGRLLGQGSVDMMNFLNDLYDGVVVDYQTKAGETLLKNPLASLLGATTPQNLAGILPDSATGHGILGRIVFVHADRIHKQVPIPPEQPPEWYERREAIINRLRWVDENRRDFSISQSGRHEYGRLYSYTAAVEDPRLDSYRSGRGSILLKIAMVIAALRGDIQVIDSDVLVAHEFLAEVEPRMHEALKYFGRNKAYVGRMLILEFIRTHSDVSVTRAEAIAAAMSELNQREAEEALTGMLASGELIVVGDRIMLPEATNKLKANSKYARNQDAEVQKQNQNR